MIFRLNFAFKILKPLIKDKKVVELGCGSGFLAKKFIEAGASSYTGTIYLKTLSSRAKKLFKDENASNKINFFAKPILDLEILDADYVFSLGLTDWLNDDEIDHMLKVSSKCDNLHSISEKSLVYLESFIKYTYFFHMVINRKAILQGTLIANYFQLK